MEHKREDILRSVLEGVTFNLNIILDVFKQYGDINEVTVIGGGAKGAVWRQIMADVYNVNILKPNHLEEATSMGAAVTAGVGAGLYKDFNIISKFINIESVHEPNTQNHKEYSKSIHLFDECYKSLVNVFDKF
jgi:xylulokinase